MAEFKRMSEAFKDLAAMKVPKLIGNGPFQLENITTKEAKMVKWDGFWEADKIKFAGIQYLNGSTQTVYPQLFSGNVHFSNVYMPPPILKRWKTHAGLQHRAPPRLRLHHALQQQPEAP